MDLTDVSLQREIEKLREAYLKAESSTISKHQFDYAVCLACSTNSSDNYEALDLLCQLSSTNYKTRDCMYHMAMINLKLGRYRQAKQAIEHCLRLCPRDFQALSLRSTVLVRTAREGVASTFTLVTILGCVLTGSYLALKWWMRNPNNVKQ
eukprot:GDKJ01021651.1.p1 GENE.GDKJ01021651.1~~GDKJ01021651.1.p1  ORF type:complete len:151 (+),score=22.20 GDKJ01021651.1:36-488(+)